MVDVKAFTRPPFMIKLLELTLGAVCLGLIVGQYPAISTEKIETVHATYFGFFILSCVVIVSYLLDTPIHGKLMMVIAGAGTIMYFTAGALNIERYDKAGKSDRILAAGIIGLLNGLLHGVDVYLSWKG